VKAAGEQAKQALEEQYLRSRAGEGEDYRNKPTGVSWTPRTHRKSSHNTGAGQNYGAIQPKLAPCLLCQDNVRAAKCHHLSRSS